MTELLTKLGWSQAFFARKVGVSTQTVSRWCNGEPNSVAMTYLRLTVRLLGVSDEKTIIFTRFIGG